MKHNTPYVKVDGVKLVMSCGACTHGGLHLSLRSPCIACLTGKVSKFKLKKKYKKMQQGVTESDEE